VRNNKDEKKQKRHFLAEIGQKNYSTKEFNKNWGSYFIDSFGDWNFLAGFSFA
jgi:hypothetical protein